MSVSSSFVSRLLMSVLLLYPSESPRSHTFTHSHTLAASNPDGWLHRSAWVSFMIPGSPTSLARHQPATQANTSLSLSLTHTQIRTHSHARFLCCRCNTSRDHRETTERPQKHPDLTHRLPSSTQTEDRSRRRRSQTELYWHHRGRISTTFFAWFKN